MTLAPSDWAVDPAASNLADSLTSSRLGVSGRRQPAKSCPETSSVFDYSRLEGPSILRVVSKERQPAARTGFIGRWSNRSPIGKLCSFCPCRLADSGALSKNRSSKAPRGRVDLAKSSQADRIIYTRRTHVSLVYPPGGNNRHPLPAGVFDLPIRSLGSRLRCYVCRSDENKVYCARRTSRCVGQVGLHGEQAYAVDDDFSGRTRRTTKGGRHKYTEILPTHPLAGASRPATLPQEMAPSPLLERARAAGASDDELASKEGLTSRKKQLEPDPAALHPRPYIHNATSISDAVQPPSRRTPRSKMMIETTRS